MITDENSVFFNEIDPDTGDYLIPPMTYAQAAEHIRLRKVSRAEAVASQYRADAQKPVQGGDIDENLEDIGGDNGGGWAVVFHEDEDPLVREALEPLIAHRAKYVSEKRLKALVYSGESPADWLKKVYGVKPGDIEPWRVPRFLLVVGSPERIPYQFSRDLPKDYAVGLLHFDLVEEYHRYVRSLICYESGAIEPRSKEAVFFHTRYDAATETSALSLVNPLVEGVPAQPDGEPAKAAVAASEGYFTRPIFDGKATGASLSSVFVRSAGSPRAAFLFSATHGAGPGISAPKQTTGAIVCQDKTRFSAQSFAEINDADVHGLFVFLNACYSAGMPERDEYPELLSRHGAPIAEKAFLAALPKALLSHPLGSAMACIGHVEKAFSYSFLMQGRRHLIPYRNAIRCILRGRPVGLALQDMRDRYVAASNHLTQQLYSVQVDHLDVDDKDLVQRWCERNEAGGYVLIGDPAARLNVKALLPVAA